MIGFEMIGAMLKWFFVMNIQLFIDFRFADAARLARKIVSLARSFSLRYPVISIVIIPPTMPIRCVCSRFGLAKFVLACARASFALTGLAWLT